MTALPDAIIGDKYRLVRPLAAGGMGSVWVAHHTGLDSEVAIKLMSAALAASFEARQRFEREAKAAAKLKSPHVVHVHDFGVHAGAPYIAMELLAGEDLGSLLERKGRLSLPRAATIFTQACKGIKAAHDAGISHRDIKPSNIFLARMGDDEIVKILDFGIARPGEVAAGVERTATGALIGTPHYMSPEQARGVETGPATDLWSLSVVLFVSLTGKLPFPGPAVGDIIAAICRDEPPPPSRVAADLPAEVDRFFERAMAKDPARRFPSATAMAEAFAAIATAAGASGRSEGSGAPAADGARPISDFELAPTLEPSSHDSARVESAPRAAIISSAAGKPAESERSGATPALPARRVTFNAAIAAASGLALLAAVLVLVVRIRQPGGAPAPPVTAAPSEAPSPTAITDLPLPRSKNPQALAAYAAALQALRDSSWDRAQERLKEAVALDPSLSSAHLRLAMTLAIENPGLAEARESYSRAAEGRALLCDHDTALLTALEPLLREPRDRPAAAQRLQKAIEENPLDAELHLLLSAHQDDPELALKSARRAVELDPQYGDAWQAAALNLRRLQRPQEALEALDHCVAVSPISVDCRVSRAFLYRDLGRCADSEADVRQALALNPQAPALHDLRIDTLKSMNAAPEAIEQAYQQKWAILPEATRRTAELLDRTRLDFYTGQLGRVEEEARELTRLIASEPEIERHAMPAHYLILAAVETGRDKDAARAAEAYLKGRAAWQGSDYDVNTVPMLRVMAHGGLLSKEALATQRDAWLAAAPGHAAGTMTMELWFKAYAEHADRPDEAAEAVAALAGYKPAAGIGPPRDEVIASMYVLAGKAGDSLAFFRRAQETCNLYVTQPRVAWYYGQALEQTGDTSAACAAYASVVTRWGAASPRSITAEKARARLKALRCPEAPH